MGSVQPDRETLASIRDASWYARPRHDHGRPSTWAPRYHILDRESGGPICAPGTALLGQDVECPAREVPEHMRCQRPGCKVRWPA